MSVVDPVVRSRGERSQLIRYAAGLVIGGVVLFLVFAQRGDLVAAWHQLDRINQVWAFGSLAAEFCSILAFAFLQRRVLAIAGARIRLPSLLAVTLANNAIALTVPGEPLVSGAFRYGQYRRRGASAAVSGWVILTVIIAQAIGLSLLI